MTVHRFYVEAVHDKAGQLILDRHLWVHDAGLLNQWLKVLRFRVGDELTLFNDTEERLYKIAIIESSNSVLLQMVTELNRRLPQKHIYLMWSLLKSDKNDWVIQKATELGVKNLVPIISERTEKPGFNLERAQKIAIEASEQCGRGDIPQLRELIDLDTALEEYKDIPVFICEQSNESQTTYQGLEKLAVFIGPEGGWSDREKNMFSEKHLNHIGLSDFTLRAETAAIIAVAVINAGKI